MSAQSFNVGPRNSPPPQTGFLVSNFAFLDIFSTKRFSDNFPTVKKFRAGKGTGVISPAPGPQQHGVARGAYRLRDIAQHLSLIHI